MKNPKAEVRPSETDNYWEYQVPTYRVTDEGIVDGEGIFLRLCRGNKLDPNAPRQEGVFTESLIELCRQYYDSQNVGPLRTKETSMAVTKLEEALLWIGKRAEDRKNRGVQGTYKP